MNETATILKQLLDYYKKDKIKLIKFALERGHTKKDIAEALGILPSGLSHFIKRNNVEV